MRITPRIYPGLILFLLYVLFLGHLFLWYKVHMYFDLWSSLGGNLSFSYWCTNCINSSAVH